MENNGYILEMDEIVKLFPGVRALDGANLKLKKGEVHALIGENGAGKSTLMNILLGIFKPDSGKIIYDEEPVDFKSPHEALKAGISMIHQEISLNPSTDVAENIWIGREKQFKTFGLISLKKRYKATQELLNHLGINLNPKSLVQSLNVANMQLTELARAVSYNPKIIIMDEPTSSLTESEVEILYKIIKELSAKGTAVIFISHKLDEIYKICSHVTVLRDGKYVSDNLLKDVTQDELIKKIAGREVSELFPKGEVNIRDEVVLEVRDFNSANVFKDINFSVRKGEILGFCGLVGAGRTEIMRAIFGIDKYDSGQLLINGVPVKILSPKQGIASGIGMVTEDRLFTGVVANLSVEENVSLAYLRTICKFSFIDKTTETQDVTQMTKKLVVKSNSIKQAVGSLSGGNQQKAIISKWLLTKPKVLILDEPTRGIDVGSKSEIHRLISQLALDGMAVIMVSSEMPEVMGMSDRIIVVREGQLVGEHIRGEATQEQLMKQAFGA